jgi:6-pyruvoyltetrahydropterin/6-carboxytetrahydropterin synthase
MGRKKLSEHSPEVAAAMRAALSEKKRQAWANREANGYETRVNGNQQAEVQEILRQRSREAWKRGDFQNRVNGMLGTVGSGTPNWTWGRPHYKEIYFQFNNAECQHCEAEENLNVHHVDEDHGNYLLSNLMCLCVPCHAWRYHYDKGFKAPFVTLTKTFPFEYAHVLPWHPGKCAQLHGHSGLLTVELKARLDPNGVVEDFYDVSRTTKLAVVDRFDHTFLNDVLENPTSEEAIIFFWRCLEDAGLKGLSKVTFSETSSTSCSIDKYQMIEAYGWDKNQKELWVLSRKPREE